MSKEETLFLTIGRKLKTAEESKMFGMPCFKTKSKAFMGLYENDVVFKLTGKDHEEAMKLKGAHLFDPSGMGRAMKEWVVIPKSNSKHWEKFSKAAMSYVKS